MLQTINVSLPENLSEKVDREIVQEGYASRSEFFRTLIRMYFLLGEEKVFFLPFKKRPLKEIEKKLKKEKYSPQFVKSVISGLANSSLYSKSAH